MSDIVEAWLWENGPEPYEIIDGQHWINGQNLFDQYWQINKSPPFDNDMTSQHPSGVNALFADGNVRFLAESIDRQTLAALCTRDQGDAADKNTFD